MKPVPKRLAALTVVALAATGLAACGKSSSTTSASSSSNKPVYGGTLNVVAASGQDHFDPVSAYGTWDYMMERAYTRQLVSYPTLSTNALGDAGWLKDTTPVADVATTVPTAANGGITDGGSTYTFHIKAGVEWNNGRQVTSQDFAREYKAFGNPISPVGNSGYFLSTIAGFATYFNGETAYFAIKSHKPTAVNIANYQNTHPISGHHHAELVDDRVPPDAAGWRLPGHPGDAVQLRQACRVRQLPAGQPADARPHDVGRAVQHHVLHARQAGGADQEPGLEAVDGPDQAPVREQGRHHAGADQRHDPGR
jgi:ABC-type transport system substrate-binding protein